MKLGHLEGWYYIDHDSGEVYYRDIDREIKDARIWSSGAMTYYPEESAKPPSWMYFRRVSRAEFELMKVQNKISESVKNNQTIDWSEIKGAPS